MLFPPVVIILLQTIQLLGIIHPINSLQMSTNKSIIKLSHRQNHVDRTDSTVPTVLLLHGLDSSSHTWRTILSELTTPAVAVDLRGCGKSDLGDPNEFCPESLVEDIHDFVSRHEYFQEGDAFVICGHSTVRKEGRKEGRK